MAGPVEKPIGPVFSSAIQPSTSSLEVTTMSTVGAALTAYFNTGYARTEVSWWFVWIEGRGSRNRAPGGVIILFGKIIFSKIYWGPTTRVT